MRLPRFLRCRVPGVDRDDGTRYALTEHGARLLQLEELRAGVVWLRSRVRPWELADRPGGGCCIYEGSLLLGVAQTRPQAALLAATHYQAVRRVEELARAAGLPERDRVEGEQGEQGEQLLELPPCCPDCGPLDYDEVIGAETDSARPAEDEPLICNLCGSDVPRLARCPRCRGTGGLPAVEEQPCGCDLLASDDCEECRGTEVLPVEVWERCDACEGRGQIALEQRGR